MSTSDCTCEHTELNPAQDMLVSGKIHILVVLNLMDFISPDADRADFERLRGGVAFAKAFRQLAPTNGTFKLDEDEEATVVRGHAFQVFRGHVRSNWLFPTYRLDSNKVAVTNSLPPDWSNEFELRIRFSRTGFLEIKLTKLILLSREAHTTEDAHASVPMIDLLRDLMEIGSRDNERGLPLQLRLALFCADTFLKALPPTVTVEEQKDGSPISTVLHLQSIGPSPEDLPFRQRYTILFLHEIRCRRCGHRINPRTLWQRDCKTLAAVLEGALIEEHGQLAFPELDDESVRLEDLATWKEELCIFAPERCLIYFPPKNIFLPGLFSPDPVHYQDYWKCIVRGIEHTIVVRAALQIVEWYTTRDLNEVPRLTKRVVDGEISDEDAQEIERLAQEVSNTFNMLPGLRDVLIPTSAYRASYAVNKFDRLQDVLYVDRIQEHVQRNVDELVIFLQFFSSMQLQEELNRGEETINQVGVVIALVSLFVAGPSFLADAQIYLVNYHHWPEPAVLILFMGIGVFLAFLIWRLNRSTRTRRRQLRRQGNLRTRLLKRNG